jgi:uncharacterized membrane-anchored protein YitT (DUF2179 family)
MPYRIDIYVGSDNGTRRIDKCYLSKIENWANTIFSAGYTIFRGRGYYNRASEESVIINVFSHKPPSLNEQLEQLKRELRQDAVLLVKSPVEMEVY